MIENTKREDIIIELGGENIRVGLVGDKVPRKTLKTGIFLRVPPAGSAEMDKFENSLEELLYNIFFSHINCSCSGKTVIVLEKVFTDRRILEGMAKVLFRKLKVERLELGLSCVTPLYLTGRYSGVVLSAGASCIEIMPVFEGYPLFQCFNSIPFGTYALNKYLKDDLMLLNKDLSIDFLKSITDDELLDVRNSCGAIGASSAPINTTVRKIRMKFIADKVNFSLFFGNADNEETNLAYSFLSALDHLPPNCFDAVTRNVVLAGGFWRIRGMQKYFKKQVKEILHKFTRLENRGIREKLGNECMTQDLFLGVLIRAKWPGSGARSVHPSDQWNT